MSLRPTPPNDAHAGLCPFCGQGLLRFWKCANCASIILLCDECELVWRDLDEVAEFGDPSHHQATYPECPNCLNPLVDGHRATDAEIAVAGLGSQVAGRAS